MNIFKRIIKSTTFQMAVFIGIFGVFAFWAIGLCGDDGVFGNRTTRAEVKTETKIVDMEASTEATSETISFTAAGPANYPREAEHDFHFSDTLVRIIPAGKTTPRRLALFQQNTLIASIEIPETAEDFQLLNYSIGATGALHTNIEVGGKLARFTSNDMYWESAENRTDPWRTQPKAEYVDNAVATTVTTKTFDNDKFFVGLNTAWRLVDGALYADNDLVLVRVMDVEHFPLVQTRSGWSLIRYDKDNNWTPLPYKLYESKQEELFRLISLVAGTKTAAVQHGVESRLKELGLTKDDIDTAQKTMFVHDT